MHDPETWIPVFRKRSCSNKTIERDDDSEKSHLALCLAFPMRIVLREHVFEVIPAFPFGWRRLVPGSRNERIRRYRRRSAHQVRNIARAVREDLACDAHDDFRAVMPGKRVRAVVDRCLAPDARAKRLAVEAHEQQPDVRVAVNIAECAVHVVAVVLGVLERVGPGDPDEAGIARTHGAIDIVLIARRDEKESRLFDELALLLPELEVEAMLLEAVGDTAAVEAVLQLAHAVVVEGGAVDRVGHGGLGADLPHVSLHSRPPPRERRPRFAHPFPVAGLSRYDGLS